jgi:DNA-binding protein Fis
MEKFIAISPSSKKVLKIAQMSSSLPVDVIILGQAGVGRKLLAYEILPNTQVFEAKELEKLILDNKINLKEYNTIIIYDINKVLNKNEFLDNLQEIKIVATGFYEDQDYINRFAVKIEVLPLDKRKEDLEQLIKLYINEANKIYGTSKITNDIKFNLSENGITLKQSIYKSILLQSMSKQDIIDTLYKFFFQELKQGKNYKMLLEIFEIPLLNASKTIYKSQLKMSDKLKINRITLRKKLSKYFGE